MGLFDLLKPAGSSRLQVIDAPTLKQGLDQRSIMLIDVREPAEFTSGSIPGAKSMPLSRFDPNKITRNNQKQLVLYCRSGQRSAIAGQKLLNAGFSEVTHLSGGISSWQRSGYPVHVD